jgi:hypothetical protein
VARRTCVHGYAAQDANARLYDQATTGTGGYFTATTGTALRVVGRVEVDRASGVAMITATRSSVTVTPGLDISSSAFVLLTSKGNLGGRCLWCTADTAANTITIRVSSAITSDLVVG